MKVVRILVRTLDLLDGPARLRPWLGRDESFGNLDPDLDRGLTFATMANADDGL